MKFLENPLILFGISKAFPTVVDSAFRSKIIEEFCKKYDVNINSGLPYINSATELVQRSNQILQSSFLTNFQYGVNLKENISQALEVVIISVRISNNNQKLNE